jgi:hypothetical protein
MDHKKFTRKRKGKMVNAITHAIHAFQLKVKLTQSGTSFWQTNPGRWQFQPTWGS